MSETTGPRGNAPRRDPKTRKDTASGRRSPTTVDAVKRHRVDFAPGRLPSGPQGSEEDDSTALASATAVLSLDLPSATIRKLVAYLDLLDRWNHVYNLTAVQGRRERRVQHLNDSLAVAAALRRGARSAAPRVLDVGSGAGLPGAVIALCWPDAQVTCVDAVGKKAAFVAQVAAALELGNLVSIHSRVESLPTLAQFDIVTARAFASLHDTVVATRSLLVPGGVWALAKGKRPDQEITALPDDTTVFHVEQISVPDLEATRHLIWIDAIA